MSWFPAGAPVGDGVRRCVDCAWAGRDAHGVLRCVAAAPYDGPGPVLPDGAVACGWFEPPVACETCGACCREAFDSVPVDAEDEATALAHPDLIRVAEDGWRDLVRVPTACGTRCVALRGDGASEAFRCAIYADRPTPCRDLEQNSPNCWFARKRVGLWPPTPAPGRAR